MLYTYISIQELKTKSSRSLRIKACRSGGGDRIPKECCKVSPHTARRCFFVSNIIMPVNEIKDQNMSTGLNAF